MGSDGKMMHKVDGGIRIQYMPDSWMNLNNVRRIYQDIIETFLIFCLLYPVLATAIYFISKSFNSVYGAYFTFVVVIVMMYFRNTIKSNFLNVFLNVLLLAASYLISVNMIERIFILVFLIVMATLSIYKRSREIVTYYNMPFLVKSDLFLLIIYFIAVHYNLKFIQVLTTIHCIVFTMVCLIYIHITRTKKLMEWEKQTSRDAIRVINNVSFKFVCILIIIFLGITYLLWRAGIFTGFDVNFILYFLSILAKIFSQKPHVAQNNKPEKNVNDITNPLKGLDDGKQSGNPILFKIFEIIMWTLITAIILPIIYLTVRAIYRWFVEFVFSSKRHVKKQETTPMLEEVTEDIRTKIKSIRDNIGFTFGLSNNSKIKKINYKLIIKNKKRGTFIKKSDTPLDIERIIKEDSNKNIDIATHIYERARYGKNECSIDELEKIKSFKRH